MTTPSENPDTRAGTTAEPGPASTTPATSGAATSGPANASPANASPAASPGVPPGPAGTVPRLPAESPAGITTPTVVVGTYPDYTMAQRAVDLLSDNKFPVEKTAIIGTDLRLVENVLGRLTTGRAALAGAASGAWFGLFIGLLFGLFTSRGWFAVILVCLLIGAAWGAIFGAIAHAATGGRRDFASRSALVAGQYAVVADPDVADQARQLLVQLNWRASGAE